MDLEIVAITKNKVTFEQFCLNYFGTHKIGYKYYSLEDNKELNLNIAYEFYEDYISSNYNLIEYAEKTQTIIN